MGVLTVPNADRRLIGSVVGTALIKESTPASHSSCSGPGGNRKRIVDPVLLEFNVGWSPFVIGAPVFLMYCDFFESVVPLLFFHVVAIVCTVAFLVIIVGQYDLVVQVLFVVGVLSIPNVNRIPLCFIVVGLDGLLTSFKASSHSCNS